MRIRWHGRCGTISGSLSDAAVSSLAQDVGHWVAPGVLLHDERRRWTSLSGARMWVDFGSGFRLVEDDFQSARVYEFRYSPGSVYWVVDFSENIASLDVLTLYEELDPGTKVGRGFFASTSSIAPVTAEPQGAAIRSIRETGSGGSAVAHFDAFTSVIQTRGYPPERLVRNAYVTMEFVPVSAFGFVQRQQLVERRKRFPWRF